MAVGTANAGKAAVLLLKPVLIILQKLIEIMGQNPVKDGPVRMTGRIDSGHSRKS